MTGETSDAILTRLIENNKYEIQEKIGTGGFGFVIRAKLINSEIYRALKVCVLSTHLQKQSFDNEVSYGKKLQGNKRTVQLIEHYSFSFERKEYGVLCYELMTIDLMDFILASTVHTELCIKKLFFNLCQSVAYLHERNIAHLDLKPENCLLHFSSAYPQNSLENLTCFKLCDFGFARQFKKDQKIFMDSNKGIIGTKEYRPPEMQHHKKRFAILPRQISFYPEKVDIWSLGICLYVMITGYFPYQDIADGRLIFDRRSLLPILDACEDDRAFLLLSRLLHPEPTERPSINDILHDEWFSELIDINFGYPEDDDIKIDNYFDHVDYLLDYEQHRRRSKSVFISNSASMPVFPSSSSFTSIVNLAN